MLGVRPDLGVGLAAGVCHEATSTTTPLGCSSRTRERNAFLRERKCASKRCQLTQAAAKVEHRAGDAEEDLARQVGAQHREELLRTVQPTADEVANRLMEEIHGIAVLPERRQKPRLEQTDPRSASPRGEGHDHDRAEEERNRCDSDRLQPSQTGQCCRSLLGDGRRGWGAFQIHQAQNAMPTKARIAPRATGPAHGRSARPPGERKASAMKAPTANPSIRAGVGM